MGKKITKSNSADASKIEILRTGQQTEFWRLIVEAIEESKAHIQKQMDGNDILDLPPEQYKMVNELFKSKKQFLDTLIKTPENLMSWLETPPNERPKEFDPYEK